MRWQTYKGTFFIIVVSLLIYFLLKRSQKLQLTTQKALSESQQSFQNLFANNPYPMWVYDLETLRFLAINEAAVTHYGYSLEEFQQMDITDIRPEEEIPAVLANAVQDRPVYQASGQWRHRTKAGKVFPVEIFSHSLAFSGRKAALVAAIDISDRQAALSALKKTESERQELQQIIDRSPVMVFLWRAEASRPVEYVSESVRKLGYNPEELTSGRMRYMEMIDPEDRPRIKAETEANIQAGIDEYIQEYRVFAKDGSKHWIEDRTYIRRDPNGKVLDIRGILQDITERKQAEIAVQDTDRRLKEIIDALPDPTFVVDKDGYVLVWNRAIEEMTGVPAENILGKGNYEYALPFYHQRRPMLTDWVLNRTEVREYYPHAEQSQGSVTAEVFLPDFKGGIYIWVKVTPLYDSYGHLAGAIETIRDITERKQAEEALQQERDLLNKLMETSPAGIIFVNAKGELTFANQSAEQILGLTKETITSRLYNSPDWHLTDFDGNPFPPEQLPFYQVATTNKPVYGVQYAIEKPGGNWAFLSVSGAPIFESDGRLNGVVFAIDNVTEEKLADTILKKERDKFKNILDSMPYGVYIVDNDYNLEYVNPVLESEFGLAVGQTCYDFFEERQEECPWCSQQDAFHGKSSRWEWTSDHNHKTYELFDTPVYNADGSISKLEIFFDVTERKRFEEELKRANDEMELRVQQRTSQMETANRELEAFSYSVSHDLRAPLRHIDGFSQALVEDCYDQLDETGQRYVERIRAGTQQMAELIDALLNLSRLTRAELQIEKVDLGPLARKILDDLQKQEPGRKVKLVINEPLSAEGDGRLLTVLLQNLLANAWKFTTHTSRPKIELGISGEKAGKPIYYVRDNGAGFDMAYADKLFGAFQRLHGKDEFPGTGIGLATVKRIITRHGGEIWAEGAVGQGAAFYFTL